MRTLFLLLTVVASLAITASPLLSAASVFGQNNALTGATGQPQQQQAEQQQQQEGVSILSSSLSNSGGLGSIPVVVGEVRNNLPDDVVNYVQIVGTFYDSSGVLIDTDYTYTALDKLRPGEKSPFKLTVSDQSVAERIDNYTLAVNWEPVNALPSSIADATVLRIEQGEQRLNDLGRYQIVGAVVNGGTGLTNFVEVVATLYDEAGKIIGVETTFTEPSDLAAGQSAPFEITVYDHELSDNIESVKLTAQSNNYFAIDPELTTTTATAAGGAGAQ
jgi:hypothetical protein